MTAISQKAAGMAERDTQISSQGYEKGFCMELDALSDTLDRTAERLKRSETYRRDFLANISHDLRTPLTMIRGYAEMLRDDPCEEPEQRKSDLNVIIRESERLADLVNDILEYSALQASAQPMEYSVIHLSEIVEKAAEQFEPFCIRNGYILRQEIAQKIMVRGSNQQLFRVLYNLLDNAFTHAQSHTVWISLREKSGVARVSVRNEGDGIADEDLPRVWERYFTRKQKGRNQKGSGLGLAIAREILTSHGAQYGVESNPERGTVFWFELPLQPENSAVCEGGDESTKETCIKKQNLPSTISEAEAYSCNEKGND